MVCRPPRLVAALVGGDRIPDGPGFARKATPQAAALWWVVPYDGSNKKSRER
ncbi:hypothetical protein Hanom_Chr12g01141801 [Helianthus anomalus]